MFQISLNSDKCCNLQCINIRKSNVYIERSSEFRQFGIYMAKNSLAIKICNLVYNYIPVLLFSE
jgi:hypothetical protein